MENTSNDKTKKKYKKYPHEKGGQEDYLEKLHQKDPEILEKWRKEQDELKKKLIDVDDPSLTSLKYVGGVDISFDKFDKKIGVSGLVVVDVETLEIVYEDYEVIKLEEPYVPGFLAFREVKPLVRLIKKLKNNEPSLVPQVILVDGNGIFHIREFGLASHLGVLADIPSIGCSKTVFALDGITQKSVDEISETYLKKKDDSYSLKGKSGKEWGIALKTDNSTEPPMIISRGHKITNETALKIVKKVSKFRIPEPIRLADRISRRLVFGRADFLKKNPKKTWDLEQYFDEKYDDIHNNLEED